MTSAVLSVIAFLALFAWRFVFTSLRRRPLARRTAAPQPPHNTFLRLVRNLAWAGIPVITDNRLQNGSADVGTVDRNDSARRYLARVVALTGATQIGNAYDLTVGKTQFHVRYRYVRRLGDLTDPQGAYEETCFYPAYKEMPKSEHIATALLELKNNPALFDRWAAQSGAFKADGQAFRPRALMHFR
jgi:hypothetical protein